MQDSPAKRLDFLKFNVRVLLSEAARRRDQGEYYWTLIGWAANARREAFSINVEPAQTSFCF